MIAVAGNAHEQRRGMEQNYRRRMSL